MKKELEYFNTIGIGVIAFIFTFKEYGVFVGFTFFLFGTILSYRFMEFGKKVFP